MVQRFRYFIEFNTTLLPEDPKGWRWQGKPDHLRFVWPKLWDTREEAVAHIAALNTGPTSTKRGLFANKDTAIPGRRIKSAAVQSVRVS